MGLSNAERQRRYIERLKAQANLSADGEALKSQIAALQAENAALKAGKAQANPSPSADGEALKAENAALKAERFDLQMKNGALEGQLYQLHKQQAGNVKPKAAKAEKPPLPPDEVREREIKSLKTQLRNLRAERAAERVYSEEALKKGVMPRATKIAIDKALHPEGSASAADKDLACKLWNAWTSASRKAGARP